MPLPLRTANTVGVCPAIGNILAGGDMGYAAEVFFTRLWLCSLLMFVFTATAFTVAVIRANTFAQKAWSSHCGHCGYRIRGLIEARCPECGLLFLEAGIDSRRSPRPPYPLIRLIVSFGLIGIAVVLLIPFPLRRFASLYFASSVVAGLVITSLINAMHQGRLRRWRSESGAMFKEILADAE